MNELVVVFGMLASFWSGFILGFYKRENKLPDIVPEFKVPVAFGEKKAERPDKEKQKENQFYA